MKFTPHVRAFVVYDADGYMFKLKSDYYLEVKSLRTMLKRTVLHDSRLPTTTIPNARRRRVGYCPTPT